jgi:hypothetical protein
MVINVIGTQRGGGRRENNYFGTQGGGGHRENNYHWHAGGRRTLRK